MYKEKTFLAIIPARGGSKGIPQKNITKVNGMPLIQFTIDEANNSDYLDRIIISTDDVDIKNIVQQIGGEIPFLRPENLASDTTKTIDVMVHAIDELKSKGNVYDYVVLLQPTQPLRKCWHIDEAIEQLVDTNKENLVSVSKVREHPILMRTINSKGNLETLLKQDSTIRRQEFSSYYKVNGAIYINKINSNFNLSTSLNDNSSPYIMAQDFDIDIDNLIDLEIFKTIINSKEKV